MTYFIKYPKLLVQRPGPRTQSASSREGLLVSRPRDCGPACGERAGRSDRWGTRSNLQLEGGVGCSEEFKIREASLFDYATKRASGCTTEGSLCLWCNMLFDQQCLPSRVDSVLDANLVQEGSCTLVTWYNFKSKRTAFYFIYLFIF